MSKEVAKQEEAKLPATAMQDWQNMAGMGSEEVTLQDIAVPFIYVLQDLSPQVKKKDPEYVEGAEPGMFYNNVSREIFEGEEKGLDIVPVYYRRVYNEWVPREKGGGFVGERDASIMEQTTRNDNGRNMLANGNEIVETGNWYVLIIDREKESIQQAVIALGGTQWKKTKNLLSRLKQLMVKGPNGKMFNPPFFYSVIKATTKYESNDKGSWSGWEFTPNGTVPELGEFGESVFAMAMSTYEGVKSNTLKVANPDMGTIEEEDDDIPV